MQEDLQENQQNQQNISRVYITCLYITANDHKRKETWSYVILDKGMNKHYKDLPRDRSYMYVHVYTCMYNDFIILQHET